MPVKDGDNPGWTTIEITAIAGVIMSILVSVISIGIWISHQNDLSATTEKRVADVEAILRATSTFDIRIAGLEKNVDRMSQTETLRDERVTRLEERVVEAIAKLSELSTKSSQTVDHLANIENYLYGRRKGKS